MPALTTTEMKPSQGCLSTKFENLQLSNALLST